MHARTTPYQPAPAAYPFAICSGRITGHILEYGIDDGEALRLSLESAIAEERSRVPEGDRDAFDRRLDNGSMILFGSILARMWLEHPHVEWDTPLIEVDASPSEVLAFARACLREWSREPIGRANFQRRDVLNRLWLAMIEGERDAVDAAKNG